MTRQLTVTIDGFSDAIQEIMNDYGNELEEIIEKNSIKVKNLTVKRLKETSPVGKIARKKKYSQDWTSRIERGRLGDTYTIYNRQPSLTHLLEKGHFKYNQFGGPYDGRTTANPHIGPAQEWASDELFNRIVKDLEK